MRIWRQRKRRKIVNIRRQKEGKGGKEKGRSKRKNERRKREEEKNIDYEEGEIK